MFEQPALYNNFSIKDEIHCLGMHSYCYCKESIVIQGNAIGKSIVMNELAIVKQGTNCQAVKMKEENL